MKTVNHPIIGKAHIEGTQRGYVVWVKTNKQDKAQLTAATRCYKSAVTAAVSIDNGKWAGHRKGWLIQVNGRSLTSNATPTY